MRPLGGSGAMPAAPRFIFLTGISFAKPSRRLPRWCQTVNASGQVDCTQLFCNTVAVVRRHSVLTFKQIKLMSPYTRPMETSGTSALRTANTAMFKPGVSLTQSSDIRIKENVETYGVTTGLAAVQALRPVTYCFITVRAARCVAGGGISA